MQISEKMLWTNCCLKEELEQLHEKRINVCGGGLSRSEARELSQIIENRSEEVNFKHKIRFELLK